LLLAPLPAARSSAFGQAADGVVRGASVTVLDDDSLCESYFAEHGAECCWTAAGRPERRPQSHIVTIPGLHRLVQKDLPGGLLSDWQDDRA